MPALTRLHRLILSQMTYRIQQQQAVGQLEAGGQYVRQKSNAAHDPTPSAVRIEVLNSVNTIISKRRTSGQVNTHLSNGVRVDTGTSQSGYVAMQRMELPFEQRRTRRVLIVVHACRAGIVPWKKVNKKDNCLFSGPLYN